MRENLLQIRHKSQNQMHMNRTYEGIKYTDIKGAAVACHNDCIRSTGEVNVAPAYPIALYSYGCQI